MLRGHKTKYYAKQILKYISKIFRFETWVGEGRGGEFELGGTVSPSHVFVGKTATSLRPHYYFVASAQKLSVKMHAIQFAHK